MENQCKNISQLFAGFYFLLSLLSPSMDRANHSQLRNILKNSQKCCKHADLGQIIFTVSANVNSPESAIFNFMKV